jgi:hypothetical protein
LGFISSRKDSDGDTARFARAPTRPFHHAPKTAAHQSGAHAGNSGTYPAGHVVSGAITTARSDDTDRFHEKNLAANLVSWKKLVSESPQSFHKEIF